MEEEIKIGEQNSENTIDPSTGEIIDNPQVGDFSDENIIVEETTENVDNASELVEETVSEEQQAEFAEENTPLVEEVIEEKPAEVVEEIVPEVKKEEEVETISPLKLVTIKKEPVVVEQKAVEAVVEKTEEQKKVEEGDIFVNYDSDFHKNQKSILQKIRMLKMTPKTSITFVGLLILITIGGIGIMMKIDPKNHSIDNYKANILGLLGKEQPVKIATGGLTVINTNTGVSITDTGVIDPTGTGATSGTGETASGSTDDKEEILIREKWLTISPDIITNQDGSISYLYKGNVFTKDELQEQLRQEVKIEINRKTKDYLNKIYIHQ
ncbi:hypothetical protein EOM39_04960 [Candidatus Gracilibacteria bacterium]|nr:hypothetical protein [Candidatus Gracilibacteria bacterium]